VAALDARGRERALRSPAGLGVRRPLRARRPLFKLAARGRPEGALVWKSLTAAHRLGTWAPLLALVVPGGVAAVAVGLLGQAPAGSREVALALVCLVLALALAMLGPSGLRIDLRMELSRLELLRALPLAGWRIVGAALLAPGLVLGALEALLVVAAFAATALTPVAHAPLPLRLAAAGALVVLLPALTLAHLCVHNAAAVLFPAWLPEREEGARGIEALGQRLLALAGSLVVLGVGLLPALLVAGAVGALLAGTLGAAAWALAGWVATGVLLGEVALAVAALGAAFDRLDVSREGPAGSG
jgi:ABC-2 type transport system permease protein